MWCVGLGFSVFARRYLQNNFCFLFLQVLRCFTSLSKRYRNAPYNHVTLLTWGFPIQKFPDQRLLGTSPKRIAAWPRLSSLVRAKASTVCSYVPIRKHNYHCEIWTAPVPHMFIVSIHILFMVCGFFFHVRVICSARPQWIKILLLDNSIVAREMHGILLSK